MLRTKICVAQCPGYCAMTQVCCALTQVFCAMFWLLRSDPGVLRNDSGVLRNVLGVAPLLITIYFLGTKGGADPTFASAKVRNAIGRIGIFQSADWEIVIMHTPNRKHF